MEFSLLGAALVGIAGLYAVLWWEAKRGNAAACTKDLWDLAITAAVAGLAVGRLAAMVRDGVNPITNPADILIVRAGVDTGFAALTALVVFALLAADELLPALDGVAAAALAGLAGWHAGCLVREDACLGAPTDLPWAWALPGSDITRHPVELYAALLYLFAAVGLLWWRRSYPTPGTVAAVALAAAGAIRWATEPFRPSLGRVPVWWYVAAVVAGTGWVVLATARSQADRTDLET